ncbi:MAG TPA: sensor histidine kinase N-terminal domain-containing protein, partial [Rubrivivax sp.]|nr:sensor histidine kinase N-terminal domain-containing protein [Rubrivivax sp.]
MATAPQEQRSLFGEILDWMLAPLLLLWPMSLGLTWVVAQAIASRPYDRELADVARALAAQASAQSPPALSAEGLRADQFERVASAFKRNDDDDRTYFQVLGQRGELLAGEAALAVPGEEPLPADADPAGVRFRDDVIGDEDVRVAYLWLPARGEGLVQVAETMGKRS